MCGYETDKLGCYRRYWRMMSSPSLRGGESNAKDVEIWQIEGYEYPEGGVGYPGVGGDHKRR
jgi:hypothetical protein